MSCQSAAYAHFAVIDCLLLAIYLAIPLVWCALIARTRSNNTEVNYRNHLKSAYESQLSMYP